MNNIKVTVVKIPQYSSKNVFLIMANDKPVCTCRGAKTLAAIKANLEGYQVPLKDGRIVKLINDLINNPLPQGPHWEQVAPYNFVCSNCGAFFNNAHLLSECPHCHVKMEKING